MGRLEGKAILVIGGGKGIGRGTAIASARQGANVLAADLNLDGAEEAAREASKHGPRCIARQCDIMDVAGVEALVATIVAEFGKLDGLVNTTYYPPYFGSIEDLSIERLMKELEVDVAGTLIAMQAALPELRKTKGSIVNFSSGTSLTGGTPAPAYAAGKAAIRALTRTAAVEMGPQGVRVNCLLPFATLAPPEIANGTADRAAQEAWEKKKTDYEAMTPLARIGDYEADIGPAIAFLLSEDARYITGQAIAVDGGILGTTKLKFMSNDELDSGRDP